MSEDKTDKLYSVSILYGGRSADNTGTDLSLKVATLMAVNIEEALGKGIAHFSNEMNDRPLLTHVIIEIIHE